MIGVGAAYLLAGLLFGAVAIHHALDRGARRHWNRAAFWGLFAASFLFGGRLGDFANGLIVLGMVAIGGFGGLGGVANPIAGKVNDAAAARWGDRLFLPVLRLACCTCLRATATCTRWI